MTGDEPAEAIVRVSADRRPIDEWSLVLEALAVPHRTFLSEAGWAIAVAPADVDRASAALAADDREQSEAGTEPAAPDLGRSFGAAVVAMALITFFFVTGPRGDGGHARWFDPGCARATDILAGQWWRVITALTLHADIMHVLGNSLAVIVFGSALCRWLGGGLAFSLVLLSGAAGNLLTALVYWGGHNSVGASTATFGALGLLGGLQFVRRMRHRAPFDRRRRALTAVAACLGLFAMIGVGERTDVVAHLMGLVSGLVLGLGAGVALRRTFGWPWQLAFGAAGIAAVVGAWLRALG